jgi:hypothetical protein
MICRKPHVASSICLCATIFQNPERTLWTHGITVTLHFYKIARRMENKFVIVYLTIDNDYPKRFTM